MRGPRLLCALFALIAAFGLVPAAHAAQAGKPSRQAEKAWSEGGGNLSRGRYAGDPHAFFARLQPWS
jgi:hypothetical protein